MDAPVVEVRYPSPPKPKFVPADDSVDMATPVVRYPMPAQKMMVIEDALDDEGRAIDFSRGVGRYATYEPRPAATMVREIVEVDPDLQPAPPAAAPAASAVDAISSSSRRTRVRGGNG